MSASHAPARDAIGLQLAATLERYERDSAAMVDTWLDMDLYQQVSGEVEQIRVCCALLPQLSVQWVELLITHAELVHSLWRLRFQEVAADRAQLHELRDRHADCAATLKSRCLRLLANEGANKR